MRWLFNVGTRHILPVCGNDTGSCPTNTRSNTFYFTQFPSKNNANACAFVIVWAIALGWYWRQNRGLPFEENQSLRFNFTHLIIGRIFRRLDGFWLHPFQTLFLHCPQLLRVVWGGIGTVGGWLLPGGHSSTVMANTDFMKGKGDFTLCKHMPQNPN